MRILRGLTVLVAIAFVGVTTTRPVRGTGAEPFRAKQHMVISANGLASQVGSDVMADGGNAIDAAIILQYSAGLIGSFLCPQNADVNHSGGINAVDAQLILQLDAGLIGSLPAGNEADFIARLRSWASGFW